MLFATRTRQVDTELLHNTNRDCTLREHLALSLSRVWGEEGLTTVKPQDLSMSYSRVAPALAEGHTITGGQDTVTERYSLKRFTELSIGRIGLP